MRHGFLHAILLIMAVLLGATTAIADSSDPVAITAEDLPSPAATTIDALATRTALQAFLSAHPDIRVERFAMPAIGGSSMDSGPLMAIAAGTPPHVMRVNFRQSATYVEQGFLDPLEILIARLLSPDPRTRTPAPDGKNFLADPTDAQVLAVLARIQPRIPAPTWPVMFRAGPDDAHQTKHVWCLPVSNNVMALLYRKDLFADAGLDPEQPPRNWDELLQFAQRLTIPERRQHGFMVMGLGDTVSWSAYSFLGSNGAEAVRQDEQGQWYAAYDNRQAAEATLFFWKLLRGRFERDHKTIEGCTFQSQGNEGTLRWMRGQIGMQIISIRDEFIAQIDPNLVGIAPVPMSPRGKSAGQLNALMFGVYSGSTPAQKLAAARYVWFITGDDARRIRTDVYVRAGFGRFVSPDLLEQFGYERLLKQVPAGWRETFTTALQNGVPEPYGKNTQNIYRWMSEPINEALQSSNLDQMPESDALDWVELRLKRSATELNQKLLGHLPDDVVTYRRRVAGAVIVGIALAFIAGLFSVWRHFSRLAPPSTSLKRKGLRQAWPYVLLLPAVTVVLLWSYLPLTMGLSIAFADYRLIRESTFVGVDNFAKVLFDEKFWYALARTFKFVALTLGLGFWPPILLAILLQEVPTTTLKYVYRTVFYLPAVVSGLIVMFLWKQLYDPSASGVLNQMLLSFNTLPAPLAILVRWVGIAIWCTLIVMLVYLPVKIDDMPRALKGAMGIIALALLAVLLSPVWSAYQSHALAPFAKSLFTTFAFTPVRWLTQPEWAMVCIVVPSVWAASGPGCILYLAALKAVPDDLYEAADIDGASHWQKVFYIVLPRLQYLIGIQFLGALIGAFKGGAEMVMVMTGGGANTNILALEIFYKVFLELEYGLGTAMAWILGALLIGLAAFQLRNLAKAEFKSTTGTPTAP